MPPVNDNDAGYYPGSSRPLSRRPQPSEPAPELDGWDCKPRRFTVAGVEKELFTIGDLAAALGRRPNTIRKWERDGTLPRATFRAPSNDVRGVRRLYSREQVEGMVRIAREEGVLGLPSPPISHTTFTHRVFELFKHLRENP